MTHNTPHAASASRTEMLNKLRAAVLGANDGIVSTAAVVMGVAGATHDAGAIFTAGLAALVAGALSMAVGEYVSVSSQSDAEKAFIETERRELQDDPDGELQELAEEFEKLGVRPRTARQVAMELTAEDALKAHLHMHFGMSEHDVVRPVHAAVASLLAFTVGGLIPFLTIVSSPAPVRLLTTSIAVILALAATGYYSANAGEASKSRAVVRVVIGGALAMIITYYVGVLFGTAVG